MTEETNTTNLPTASPPLRIAPLPPQRGEATPAESDRELIDRLLIAAKALRFHGRSMSADAVHEAIARLEGPEWDGMS